MQSLSDSSRGRILTSRVRKGCLHYPSARKGQSNPRCFRAHKEDRIRTEAEFDGNSASFQLSAAYSGADCSESSVGDADLAEVVAAWLSLSKAARASILTIIRAADAAAGID